jgi:preprotein translocase SecE subunit
MEAVSQNPNTNDEAEDDDKPSRSASAPAKPAPGPKAGFFHIYKKGQGYYTRMGTVAGAVLIGALTAYFIYDNFDAIARDQAMDDFLTKIHLQEPRAGYLLVLIFAIAYSALAFRLMNKPANADFLIATDAEMKRVNWTTQKELIGSTRVVIFFMFFMAILLFVYDLFFHTFFWLIGVLKAPPPFIHGGQ